MERMKARKWEMLAALGMLAGLLALAGGCVSRVDNGGGTPAQIIADITPEKAHALIQDNKGNRDFVILDVRTLEEYADGHIENAVNLDYYSDTFKDELNKLDKSKTYLVYCRTANRSGIAVGMMKELGFREVYNMLGGIVRWEADGLPTVK